MLSPQYVKNIFMSHVGSPRELYDGKMIGSCPICHEGNSFGKKKRLYYYPETGSLFCFNCQHAWSDLEWCSIVLGQSKDEILKEAKQFGYFVAPSGLYVPSEKKEIKQEDGNELPDDAINLKSTKQLSYYGNDKYISLALDTIKHRRLDSCVNKLTYYISLKDKIHKNRLIIPFTDRNGNIIFYQSRSLDGSEPKYLGKQGSEKPLFGYDKIDLSLNYYFVFEGPIDSCFVQNGVAICGLDATERQENEMNSLFTQERVWILDNDFRTNKEVLKKYNMLLENNERVFIWPRAFIKYKDLNDLCIDRKMDSISPNVFIDYSFTGRKGYDMLNKALTLEY